MERIEAEVTKRVAKAKQENQFYRVLDPINKAVVGDPQRTNKELLAGRYRVKFNKGLTFKKRVERMAEEPVAYYLHKRRDFIDRLKKIQAAEEKEDKRRLSEDRLLQ